MSPVRQTAAKAKISCSVRFLLRAHYTTNEVSGIGRGVRLTEDTGAFWFFNDTNYELMVKVLDGRDLNGNFWVFYGSLTNVQFRLDVTDLVTGETVQYVNPAVSFKSRGDTDALSP